MQHVIYDGREFLTIIADLIWRLTLNWKSDVFQRCLSLNKFYARNISYTKDSSKLTNNLLYINEKSLFQKY